MRVEVLFIEDCPNHGEAVEIVRAALRAAGHSEQIHQVEIRTQAEAEALAFLGSPSVRLNGVDIEPEARSQRTYGLSCRTYRAGTARSGVPSIALILHAIAEISAATPLTKGSAWGKRIVLGVLLAVALGSGAGSARAQKSPAAAREPEVPSISGPQLATEVLKAIEDVEKRTVEVVEDFPDNLYNTYRPQGNPEVRTAAEILLHVAEQNYSAASLIRTKEQQEALIASGKKPSAKEILTYVSKPDTAAKVKASFAAVRSAIEGNPDPKHLEWWLYVIAHGNWHFGNLVTYYRENGLVPPSSRQ